MKAWIEVSIKTNAEAQEAVSEFLMQAGSSGVAVEDPAEMKNVKDLSQVHWSGPDLSGDQDVLVRAYFEPDHDLEELECDLDDQWDVLLEVGLISKRPDVIIQDVYEEDWLKSMDEHYQPIQVSRFLRIVPASKAHSYNQSSNELPAVLLDPGVAFGTGQHPTTLLAMLAMEKAMQGGERVVDVGSGSGVLSITAGRLGASQVRAYDIDPQAVESTQKNWDLNQLDLPFSCQVNDLLQGQEEEADLIVANLVADYVIPLLPQAKACLTDKGQLIVSGIIVHRQADVLEAIEQEGYQVGFALSQGDWRAYILSLKEDALHV